MELEGFTYLDGHPDAEASHLSADVARKRTTAHSKTLLRSNAKEFEVGAFVGLEPTRRLVPDDPTRYSLFVKFFADHQISIMLSVLTSLSLMMPGIRASSFCCAADRSPSTLSKQKRDFGGYSTRRRAQHLLRRGHRMHWRWLLRSRVGKHV